MDQNHIYQLFVATYNPDPGVHKQAELSIRGLEAQNGFLPIVLEIVSAEVLELGARQAAAIYFKNRVYRAWDRSKNTVAPINEEDRLLVKQRLLQALVTVPSAVKVQLAPSLKTILEMDFPDQWPHFMEQVQSFLSSSDTRQVYVGLLALRAVIRVYQWKDAERREPLHQIIQNIFPVVQQVCAGLVNADSFEAAEMIKTGFKIYHNSIIVELPKCLQDNDSLVSWGTLFIQMVEKPIPFNVLSADPTEREAYPWGKTKKWAYHCLNLLFGKFGNPAMLPAGTPRNSAFAKQFSSHFAPNIIQTYLMQIDGWIKKEHWLPLKCLTLSAAFLDDAIKHKATWQIIKPHTDVLVSQFIFPQLCISPEDELLWQNDPVDYIHKKIDPLEDFLSPQINVTNLLIDLASCRRKHTFMGILNFINNTLVTYLQTPDETKNGREKDGAMAIIGYLADLILSKKSPVANMMEPFFVAHVFPEFTSRFPYLRARACDITRRFSGLEFENEENINILYTFVLGCLRDNELPVKVQAALALQPMIFQPSLRESMEEQLPFIMEQLLNLSNEIDVDIISSVMENFVENFAQQLTPFAVQLCSQLRDMFLRVMDEIATNTSKQRADTTPEEEELDPTFGNDADVLSEKMKSAMGVLKTIGTLILSLESSPDVLQQLETALLPVITYTLQNNVMDLYDEIFEIIDSCTFSAKRVTPTMWSVFELIYKAFSDSAIDYMDAVLPPLDNYIFYGNEVFIANENYQRMMYDIIDSVMKSDQLTESDRTSACKLISSVLLNCRGHVDSVVLPFLNLAFQYIFTGSMRSIQFKVHCMEVVINCLYYNPVLTLRILEDNQWTQGFFTLWFQSLDKFSRVHDKKLIIVSLCSVLSLPVDQVPATVQAGWSQILATIIQVFDTLPKAIENREAMEKQYGDEDYTSVSDASWNEGGSTGDDDTVDNDDEDIQDEDQEYLEFLAQQAANMGGFDEDDEELEEELLFETPLDVIDPYVHFEQVFKDLQQHHPNAYTLLTKDVDADQQNTLMTICATAEQARSNLTEL
ncbi:ARM repeat-containing protein [Hesseltinella vesiculosa]|uniref:ARM repeat-containing protein n=1 Tax=Hesseltinella vesiculosa TaxID=101127 RepID=A0A1X2GJQ7_9FUNG|nr:ARM repeat-containing protein [Hesseltinella vesiculosa]